MSIDTTRLYGGPWRYAPVPLVIRAIRICNVCRIKLRASEGVRCAACEAETR